MRSVTLVADHAPGWAKTAAAARAELLQQVIDDTMAAARRVAGRARARPRAWSPARPRRARSSSPGWGRSCAWRACSATRCATSRRTASPRCPGRSARRPTGGCASRSSRPGAFDRITFPQTTAEVWMQPGVTREALVRGPGGRLRRPGGARGHGPRPGRGQRRLAGPARRALQALRGGQDRRHEGEPGERLSRPALERGAGGADRRRRAAHRRGRRRRWAST